ncbi:putative beta-galactosidase A [Aspergillus coremiiformis]|uniref:Beta-galactosidase n=1 Tax=Aspergillus coremiiformis TaxID=138285 RepID=A0A5N6ZFU0_9EURO|nr:putative beta-galactosidase A [Aspergillus coremiiformis]
MKLLSAVAVALLASQTTGASIKHHLNGFTLLEHPDPAKRGLLQDIVTWDNQSLSIHGERIMIFSGEFHPFRLPVPSLWLDVLQKIKALGFNCVSFYIDWALVEGKPGDYRAEGIFALEPFFEAAKEAGIYLIARNGPYINAEVSGGGFPGWLQRLNGTLRSSDQPFLQATDNYVAHAASSVAKAQITNGGPVILFQPENEYTSSCCGVKFPDGDYMQYVMDQARKAGIVVPFINNDASPSGHNAPGTGVGAADIYGHDSYPLGFDCAHPSVWPKGNLPESFRKLHLQQSPSTPYSILEFQAGSFDPWGGPGFDQCYRLLNHEFSRVFYRNDFSFGVVIMNLYMVFGGTNWGNLGHPGGYTSYDYGSPLTESRTVTREKYSDIKLLSNFAKASPDYLTAVPGDMSTGVYTDTHDVAVTPLIGDPSGSFFVLRHSDYSSQESTSYQLRLPTSAGTLNIPQLGGSLSLHGRDSKIHVVDYNVSGTNILYSTAEVFTWKRFHDHTVLVLYGAPREHHELAIASQSNMTIVEGSESGIESRTEGGSVVISWDVSPTRRIIQVDNLRVFLLDRNSAYNYWVPELATQGTSPGFSTAKTTASSIIVKAGYLVRGAHLDGADLHLTADFNATTPIEVIGAPKSAQHLLINGKKARHTVDKNGIWSSEVQYKAPKITLPALQDLKWKTLDSLPEIQSSYDDAAWTAANLPTTRNTYRPLDTPTSLYSSDYGFHAGYLIYRGHFVANGKESEFVIHTQGGSAFGSSIWLNGTHLGSWAGADWASNYNATYQVPQLQPGKPYVITVVVDNMGLDENWTVGGEGMKGPRGILDYALRGQDARAISWKLTGNLGGEDYHDKVRGPLNEGGLYAERHGFHQPQPPSDSWESGSPLEGLSKPGIQFYTAPFDLDLPKGWDVPLSFTFGNNSQAARAQLYVNGYQFGKFTGNVGPQTSFPVPEGILNYRGTNWVALSLWALEPAGAQLESLELSYTTPVLTGYGDVVSPEQPTYTQRTGAY